MDVNRKQGSFQQLFEEEKKKIAEEMNSKDADSTYQKMNSERAFDKIELQGKGSELSMELSRIYEDILKQILEIKSAKKEHETCSDELTRMDKEILLYKSYTLFSKLDKEITDIAMSPGGSGEANGEKSVQIHDNFPISYNSFKRLIKFIQTQKVKLDELTRKNESAHKRLNSTISNKLSESKTIMIKLQKERDSLKKESSDAMKAFLFLKGEVGNLKKTQNDLGAQIQSLNLTISEKEAKIQSQNAYMLNQESVIEEYTEKVEALEKEKRELENICRARLAQLNVTAECYKDRNQQNEKLLNDVKSIKDYLSEYDQKQRQKTNYERENLELKETLSTFKIKVDSMLLHHDKLGPQNSIGDSLSYNELCSTPKKINTPIQTMFRIVNFQTNKVISKKANKSPSGWNSNRRLENSLCSPINLTKIEDSVENLDADPETIESVRFMGGDSSTDEGANGELRNEDRQSFWLNQIEQIVENMKEEKMNTSSLYSSYTRITPRHLHTSTLATSSKLKDFQHLKNQSI